MIPLTALLGLTATLPGATAEAPPFRLENGWWRLAGQGAELHEAAVDPTGRSQHGANTIVRVGYVGIKTTAESAVRIDAERVTVTNVEATRRETHEVANGGVPVQTPPGGSLGQGFTVRSGRLRSVSALLPTWHTADSSATLRLRRQPAGDVVAERRIDNVPDNSWQSLEVDLEPGEYRLELTEVRGTVGWWGANSVGAVGGTAWVGDRRIADHQRAIRWITEAPIGRGEVAFTLEGPRLTITASVTPNAGERLSPLTLDWRVAWNNDGYDTSAAAVPFRRFYTDHQRYLPVEQLKRWRLRDGRYELTFGGCRWIEADGTDGHDLRWSADALDLAWQLDGRETSLLLSPAPAPTADILASTVAVELRPRDDSLPADWPRFRLPDETAGSEASTFFYERAWSYPPIWGPAAWFEWNALARVWQLGDHLSQFAEMLRSYPIAEDGYVHTWGSLAGWPFPDPNRYDTRHFDTNARYILACWRYAAWTGDRDFLAVNLARIRRAMAYQIEVLGGKDGLITTVSPDVTGRHRAVGNNYWDILPFGHLDAYANIVWYASLEAMAQIEEMAVGLGPPPDVPPNDCRALAERARAAYNQAFWDERAGRYIGCIDRDGQRHDYGFTFINLEAIAYGLAEPSQAARIYRWLETEPTSSGHADTYTRWVFAPRANTIHNPRWHPDRGKLDDVPEEPWWHFGWHGTAFDEQCQDGGAILYTSFYDLLARTLAINPDDAWRRWSQILERWREPDRLCGGAPLFRGEHPQQIDPGSTGTDIPFPESGLVPCWLLYGLMGVQACADGLRIAPRLPSTVAWLAIDNVGYRGRRISLRVTRSEVEVRCDEPGRGFVWREALPEGGAVGFHLPEA